MAKGFYGKILLYYYNKFMVLKKYGKRRLRKNIMGKFNDGNL